MAAYIRARIFHAGVILVRLHDIGERRVVGVQQPPTSLMGMKQNRPLYATDDRPDSNEVPLRQHVLSRQHDRVFRMRLGALQTYHKQTML